jgi:lipid II:glycine glycyltransferase (peptidoglycan interpeptide bridge formation enzyme)
MTESILTTYTEGIISRRWPVLIKNFWFDQRPKQQAIPDIARLHSILRPLEDARNIESWTILVDLTKNDSYLLANMNGDTRKQVRRAEREGVHVERFDGRHACILEEFDRFFQYFSQSKSEVRGVLKVSVQMHMLKILADAGMLDVSRAVSQDGETLVYQLYILAGDRARIHVSASLFREESNIGNKKFLGRANRYLNWQNMLYYRQQGYSFFDMGGWYSQNNDESLLRVNHFKESFGGERVCEYDAIYGCTPRGRLFLPVQFLYRQSQHVLSRIRSK